MEMRTEMPLKAAIAGDVSQNNWVFVERRDAQRFMCRGAASIWHPGFKHFVRGTVTNVSLSGCYVEVMTPLNVRDKIALILNINETEVRTAAEVRTSRPGVGMGLKFMDMTETTRSNIRALVSRLGHSGSGPIEVEVWGYDGNVAVQNAGLDSQTW